MYITAKDTLKIMQAILKYETSKDKRNCSGLLKNNKLPVGNLQI